MGVTEDVAGDVDGGGVVPDNLFVAAFESGTEFDVERIEAAGRKHDFRPPRMRNATRQSVTVVFERRLPGGFEGQRDQGKMGVGYRGLRSTLPSLVIIPRGASVLQRRWW